MTKIRDRLSSREERLLLKHRDDECNFVERLLVDRLKSNPGTKAAAQEFLKLIDSASAVLKADRAPAKPVDLWARVSARIEAEQRSEVFLGRRASSGAIRGTSRWRQLIQDWRLGWAVPGAAMAGLLAIFLRSPAAVGPAFVSKDSIDPAAMTASDLTPPRVNLASTGLGPNSRITLAENDPVEVDWVRGNGRVRVLQDPSRRSAIIWVKRREPSAFVPNMGTPVVDGRVRFFPDSPARSSSSAPFSLNGR